MIHTCREVEIHFYKVVEMEIHTYKVLELEIHTCKVEVDIYTYISVEVGSRLEEMGTHTCKVVMRCSCSTWGGLMGRCRKMGLQGGPPHWETWT